MMGFGGGKESSYCNYKSVQLPCNAFYAMEARRVPCGQCNEMGTYSSRTRELFDATRRRRAREWLPISVHK